MKHLKTVISILFLVSLYSLALAQNDQQLGKELFSTPLGTNGKSCSSCHPDGKGLEHADDFQGAQLREMINFCIRDALKGQLLPLEDPRLAQLELYVRSLKK